MRGEITLKILEALETGVYNTAEVLDVCFSNYQDSYRKSRKLAYGGFSEKGTPITDSIRTKQSFYDRIYRLRKDGLIAREKSGWFISKNGKEKLKKLRNRKSGDLPEINYTSEKEDGFNLVIFDIPESERKKRAWLRVALRNLNFSLLQASVWIGKNKIPEEFLHDLQDLGIFKYIEILSIGKTGTLKQIK